MKIIVPYFKQEKSTTCGPACLRMILAFEDMNYSENELEMACETGWMGNTCEEIAEGAKNLGFDSEVIENITIKDLKELLENKHPIIALLSPSVLYGGIVGFGHFVTIIGLDEERIYYHDPGLEKDLSKERDIFFEAWEKYSFKGVRIWKSMKK
ncbi:MAG: cysteine peptidase family C39 domain-containing protein [bacterium]